VERTSSGRELHPPKSSAFTETITSTLRVKTIVVMIKGRSTEKHAAIHGCEWR
jgi:hypothetical protein